MISHNKLSYSIATSKDLPFIMDTYNANIEALHGAYRSIDVWEELLADESCQYYIVHWEKPVAWFRIDEDDKEDDTAWLGMLQVNPVYHHQGVGKYVLSTVEDLVKKEGYRKIGIHTTEDNIAAKNLYLSCGYEVLEYGPCSTADGVERMGFTLGMGI